jgi:hypothetical protein
VEWPTSTASSRFSVSMSAASRRHRYPCHCRPRAGWIVHGHDGHERSRDSHGKPRRATDRPKRLHWAPTVAEDDRLARASVLVKDRGTVLCCDGACTQRMHSSVRDRTETPHITDHMACDKQTACSRVRLDHLGELVMRDYWPFFSCCAMNASAVSATSRHPWSMVRECPRSGISWISVTPGFFSCCL